MIIHKDCKELEESLCDSCGWNKKIVFVDEYGKGFCEECLGGNER